MDLKAYRVYNSRITNGTTWSGVVIAEDNEEVSEAIMKHHGLPFLFDEKYPKYRSKNYTVEEIPLESVSLCDLTVGELVRLLKTIK